MEWYWIAAFMLVAYIVILYSGQATGVWKRAGASTYGPILLWRTRRGISVIHRLARRARAWDVFAIAGAVLAVTMMVVLTLFLFWVSYSDPALPRVEAASQEVGPGLPTESLAKALVYGGLGMVVAVIVHELGHGIVASAHRLRLDSVGILFLAIPMGAFVEPNDDDLGRGGPPDQDEGLRIRRGREHY